MNRLTSGQRAAVISCLIEGNSVRSTVRITGVAKKTVMRLVVEVGSFCAQYQDRVFQNLKCERMQVDECWSFCYCKQKTVTEDIASKNPGAGDAWLWAAIDAILSWYRAGWLASAILKAPVILLKTLQAVWQIASNLPAMA